MLRSAGSNRPVTVPFRYTTSCLRPSRRARGHDATARAPSPAPSPPTSSGIQANPPRESDPPEGVVSVISQPRAESRRNRRRRPSSAPPGSSAWQTARSFIAPEATARRSSGARLGRRSDQRLRRRCPGRLGTPRVFVIRVLVDTTFALRGHTGTGVYLERITRALEEIGVDVVEAANTARRAPGAGGPRSAVNWAT